jgi:RimJ/RimL family protein N-acetyltransferase
MQIHPITLEGRLVRLVPLSTDHIEALWRAGNDPDLWRLTSSRVQSPEDMRRYVETALAEQERGTSIVFSTVEKKTAAIVGSTRFGNIASEHKRVEVGWTWVTFAWQRTYVNTEAKLLMFGHAFEEWGCNRVELKTSALNMRSRKSMLRLGLKEEGTLRRHMINPDGTVRDTVYFSVIAEEWPEMKARLRGMLGQGE